MGSGAEQNIAEALLKSDKQTTFLFGTGTFSVSWTRDQPTQFFNLGEDEVKLADALLRRKELQEKVNRIKAIQEKHLFQVEFSRKPVNDTIDDIVAKIPVVELNQVTAEYDYYANKLRLVDGAIQQLNWTTDIKVDDAVWLDFADRKSKK